MIVREILKAKGGNSGVLTLEPGAKVFEAVAIMSQNRIGTVVVSAEGTTADGILSERDIVRELGQNGAGCMEREVQDLMTPNPVTCTPRDDARAVLETMTERRFRHMPVLEDGKMTGLISIGDVVKARLSELSMERNALEGMIRGS